MAENENRTDEHCTFGAGIPDGLPANGQLPPEYLGGPGSYEREPDRSSSMYYPDEAHGYMGLQHRVPGQADGTWFGVRGTLADGTIFIDSPTAGLHAFKNEAEADAFMRDNGVMQAPAINGKLPDAAIEERVRGVLQRTGGFPSRGMYMAASDTMKMLMRNITRLTGNGWEAVRAHAAITQSNETQGIFSRLNFYERYKELDAKAFDAAMAQMPEEDLLKTLAGRLMYAHMAIKQSLYDRDSVLAAVSRQLGFTRDYAGSLERQRNRIGAVASGEGSPQVQTLRALQEMGKKYGWTFEQLSLYRLALHTAERAEMADSIVKHYSETSGIEADRIRSTFLPDLENPAAFPRFNAETGRLDLENPVRLSRSESLLSARQYLDSLPAEQRAHLESANKILTKEYTSLLGHMYAEGMISHDQFNLYSRSQNYMPLRDHLTFKNGVRPIPAETMIGRATLAENPVAQLFGWLEGGYRRNAQNRLNRTLYDWAAHAVSTGLVRIDNEAIELIENEPTQRATGRRGDDNSFIVRFPAEKPGDNPIIKRVSFDTSRPLGRLLAKAYVPEQARGQLYQAAAGFNRFASILMTNAKPSWALKNTAWNLGVTPFSVQSAFGMTTAQSIRFLRPYLMNVGRLYHTSLHPSKHVLDDPLTRLLIENGAGTINDSRFDPGASARASRFDMTPLREMARTDPLGALQQGAKKAWRNVLHISHTPDIAFQVGAAKTYIEQTAGRDFKTYDEALTYARQNPQVMDQALAGSRRILPNFTRKGTMTTLSAFFPFFNATAQTLPFMGQMAKSPTGLAGAALGILAGYATLEFARDEMGEDGGYLKNADANVYLGHGVQVPVDYAGHPAMKIGNELWKLQNGYTDMHSATAAVALAMADALSPVGAPGEGQDPGYWALYNIAPYAVRPAITGLTGRDPYGNAVDADTATDATGKRIEDPYPYQLARPNTPGWANAQAKAFHDTIGDYFFLTGGRIAAVENSVFPGVAGAADVFSGQSQAKYGETPSAAGGLLDIIAPSFQAHTDLYAGRTAVEDAFRHGLRALGNPNALPTTKHNLLTSLGPQGARLQTLRDAADRAMKNIRVEGYNTQQLTRMKLHAASQAERNRYDELLAQVRAESNRIGRHYAELMRQTAS